MVAAVVSLKTLSPQPTLVSAGTAQQITTTTVCARSFFLYAPTTNTGAVYIGDSDPNAKLGTGVALTPGQFWPLEGDNANGTQKMLQLSSWYFDGVTTGNKLVVHYIE